MGTVENIAEQRPEQNRVSASVKGDMKDALRKIPSSGWLLRKPRWPAYPVLMRWLAVTTSARCRVKEPQDHFVALDTQPKYHINNGELMIHLRAPDLGFTHQRIAGLLPPKFRWVGF